MCSSDLPRCADCPVAKHCTWRSAGKPSYDGPVRPGQTYAGTDRQVRGLLLAAVRESAGPVPQMTLDGVWEDDTQRARALAGLLEDGLVEPLADGRYRLPGTD